MEEQRRTHAWLAGVVGITEASVEDLLSEDPNNAYLPKWTPPPDVAEAIERALDFWEDEKGDKGRGIGRLWAAVAELDPVTRREVVDEFIGQFNRYHPQQDRHGRRY